MTRHLRYAALMGACLLGMGCEETPPPGLSEFVPEAQYVAPGSFSLHTRISGLAWDPEAYFMTLAACGPTCPMPPFLSEGLPLFQHAAVQNAAISAFDPLTQTTTGDATTTDGVGIWVLPQVPSRATAPYFILAEAQGSLPSAVAGPPLPNVPSAPYLRTLTLRPITTVAGMCLSMEAVHISSQGILEAVAKYLSSKGTSTLVSDLVNPTRYHSVTVLGLFHGGNGANRAPADQIAVESSVGQVYHINWAPPGSDSDPLRSSRGFIVTESQKTPVGFAVVLVPATLPRPEKITYTVKDTKEDDVARRPWFYPPISAPPQSGVITFIGAQMGYQPPSIPIFQLPPPPTACVPM